MRRLLACIVAVTAGGCSCFDNAYVDFCTDTGRCDPAATQLQGETSVRAGSCRLFNLRLLDSPGGATLPQLARPVRATFGAYPPGSVEVHETNDCMGPIITELSTSDSVANLYLVTRIAGGAQLYVDLDVPGVPQTTLNMTSQGRLRFAANSYAVSGPTCGGGTLVTLNSVTDEGAPLVAGEGVEVPLLPLPTGLIGLDELDGGCVSSPIVRFMPGVASGSVTISGTTSGTSAERLRVNPTVDPVFLNPQPEAWVSSTCTLPGAQAGTPCCDGAVVASGQCCLPFGRPCVSNADCCMGSCNTTCQ